MGLTAVDKPGEAGVMRTYYGIDTEGFQVNAGPFTAPVGATRTTPFSVDRSNTIEAPAATLVAGRQLFLPIVAK